MGEQDDSAGHENKQKSVGVPYPANSRPLQEHEKSRSDSLSDKYEPALPASNNRDVQQNINPSESPGRPEKDHLSSYCRCPPPFFVKKLYNNAFKKKARK